MLGLEFCTFFSCRPANTSLYKNYGTFKIHMAISNKRMQSHALPDKLSRTLPVWGSAWYQKYLMVCQ